MFDVPGQGTYWDRWLGSRRLRGGDKEELNYAWLLVPRVVVSQGQMGLRAGFSAFFTANVRESETAWGL